MAPRDLADRLSARRSTSRQRAFAQVFQPRGRRDAIDSRLVTAARYQIEHETRYVHTGGVSTSQHVAYLRPRTLPHQRVKSHEMEIDPVPASRLQRIDCFGNNVDQFTILTPYDEMRVISRSIVEVTTLPDPMAGEALPWDLLRDDLLYQRGAPYEAATEFSYSSPYVATAPELAEF